MKKLWLCAVIMLTFSHCAGVLVAGAAAGAVVYDSRSIIDIERDTRIYHHIHRIIVKDRKFAFSNIQVSVFNQVVLLTGQVSSAGLKVAAEKIAQTTPNVERVYDQLVLDEPISMAQTTRDSWISSQIKAKMLTAKGLRSGSIKVVTSDGVVYLMGIVKKQQANKAANIARQVEGVKKVVKVFQYII